MQIQMNPEEITDLENNCNNEDVLKLKKNIGTTIKIHRNDLNHPAFHCMIDKNHKYFYVIQGEVEYNDNINQSLEPNQFDNSTYRFNENREMFYDEIINIIPKDSYSKDMINYMKIRDNVTDNIEHLNIYKEVIKEMISKKSEKESMEVYYKKVAEKLSDTSSNVKTVFNRIRIEILQKLITIRGE